MGCDHMVAGARRFVEDDFIESLGETTTHHYPTQEQKDATRQRSMELVQHFDDALQRSIAEQVAIVMITR